MATTLFEKIWDAHVVDEAPGEPALLYVDLHLVHEVTLAAGVRGAAARGAARAAARPDGRDDGSQRPDRAGADHRPDREGAARRARGQLRRVRRAAERDRLAAARGSCT